LQRKPEREKGGVEERERNRWREVEIERRVKGLYYNLSFS